MKFLILLVLTTTFALAQNLSGMREKLDQQLAINEQEENKITENIKQLEDLNTSLLNEIQDWNKIIADRVYLVSDVQKELRAAIDSFSHVSTSVSKKAKFYLCVQTSLSDKGITDVPGCLSKHEVRFSKIDEEKIKQWEDKLGQSSAELEMNVAKLRKRIENNNGEIIQHYESKYQVLEDRKRIHDKFQELGNQQKEIEFLAKNQKFFDCDINSPEINLEQEIPYPGADFKGPFAGITQEHQDGLGTCYANAAKNLLIGISGGEDNASFLDMALQYSRSSNGKLRTDIEGGESCSTLRSIREYGFCPKEYSPVEMGEANTIAGGLFAPGASSVKAQAVVIKMLGDYFSGVTKFENQASDKALLGRAKIIIDELKSNPRISIPVPVLRHEILSKYKLLETWIHVLKKRVPEEEFLKDYENAYKDFRPLYIKAIIEGKNLDQVFNIFKDKMQPFIQKYGFNNNQIDSFKYSYKYDSEGDYLQPDLAGRVKESLEFLRKHTKKNDLSDEAFIDYCLSGNDQDILLLNQMNTLVTKLKEQKLDPSSLFDENGKFRNSEDLMQLATAPMCLNPDKRKKVNRDFSCKMIGFDSSSDKKAEVRKEIVLGLLKGIPSGNVFPFIDGRHINTIVGIRFNKERGICEYRIRESQTGTSEWHGENRIVEKIEWLTVVKIK